MEKTRNTENIKRKRQTLSSSKSTSNIPQELSSEILSKLPAKSVLRFRCVSKLWSSITREPYFINSFETRPNLLLAFKEGDNLFVFKVPQHNQTPNKSYSYSTSEPIDSFNITLPKRCSFATKTESVHGLICFHKSAKLIVWNPTTRQYSILPEPDASWKGITVFLAYDPIEGKHKVLSFPSGTSNETYNECRVLTLESDQKQSWRPIKTEHNYIIFSGFNRHTRIYGRCINGVLYYMALRFGTERNVWDIMRFDVKSEKLDMIELPSWGQYKNIWYMDRYTLEMISYEGKLAFVNTYGNSITIRILENAEKREWSSHLVSSPTHYEAQLATKFNLIGTTDDGELIYVLKSFLTCLDIIYINPKRKTFRRVGYSGIVDDDFRQRNGIGNKRLRWLQFFPNTLKLSCLCLCLFNCFSL